MPPLPYTAVLICGQLRAEYSLPAISLFLSVAGRPFIRGGLLFLNFSALVYLPRNCHFWGTSCLKASPVTTSLLGIAGINPAYSRAPVLISPCFIIISAQGSTAKYPSGG